MVLLAVPEPNLAVGTVPDAILEPFKLVSDAPEPLNVVAVHTPALPRWILLPTLIKSSISAYGEITVSYTHLRAHET